MKTTALILLSLLAAWWALLTVFLILNYRKRVQEASIPLTAKEREECKELEASVPRYQMRPIHFALISPVILVMLPVYLYGWLVKDPCEKLYKD